MSSEERLDLGDLIGHDLIAYIVSPYKMTKELDNARRTYAKCVASTIYLMQRWDDVHGADRVTPDNTKIAIEDAIRCFDDDRISIDVNLDGYEECQKGTLYHPVTVGVHNLVSNALRYLPEENGEVNVRAEMFRGMPKDWDDVVFYAGGALTPFNSYLKITVEDNGSGFPQDVPFIEWTRKGKTTGNEMNHDGLGLYFNKLMCKFLVGSIMTIESKPGDTKISLYID